MKNEQTLTPLAQQAMNVMDDQGEAAMWGFIASHTLKECQPPEQKPPKSVYLMDGCIIHLSEGRYTFINRQKDQGDKRTTAQRNSTTDPNLVPGFFQPAQPLFWWPSQEHLYQEILQLALNQESDRAHPNSPGPQTPRADEVDQFIPEVFETVQAWTPMSNPDSPSLRDDLQAFLLDLAQEVFANMDDHRRTALKNKAARIVAKQNGATHANTRRSQRSEPGGTSTAHRHHAPLRPTRPTTPTS